MDIPEPRYAKTSDDTHIAYLVMGDGPIDLVYAFGYMSNIDADADVPFHAAFRQRLASIARLILFDRRGTGLPTDQVWEMPDPWKPGWTTSVR